MDLIPRLHQHSNKNSRVIEQNLLRLIMINMTSIEHRKNVLSQNNLTLCKADYFETCWCKINSSEPISCPYLLQYIVPLSNSSYFCVYHRIRKTIDCFNSSNIFPKKTSVSNLYIYLTIFIFLIGLIGNGLSIIILLNKTLRRLSVYRNLIILCGLNIFYLLAILIRYKNNFNQDLREISSNLCRVHTFIVAFTGHVCSWQLVSMSIQRVYALLSLHSHRQKSWIQTLTILFICIVLPLFIFDGQLLFSYGFFCKSHVCDNKSTLESKQFQRALQYPINNTKLFQNISIRYHANFFQNSKPIKCGICILWNIFDTFLYAILPFIIILISSIIIIYKIIERRRSMINFGGICHLNQRMISAQDNLSILLIMINCLFLIMTGPFNICLIIQSIIKYFYSKSFSSEIFFQLNQYLRLLQNSYHASSFIFYCLAGKKFRQSALTTFQKIYSKLFQISFGYKPNSSTVMLCCADRKKSLPNKPTVSTSAIDIPKQNKKQTYITIIATDKKVKTINTFL